MSEGSDARSRDLLRQQFLLDQVIADIVAGAPEGWVRIDAVLVLLGRMQKMQFEISTADGPYDGVPDIFVPDAAPELRDSMYVAGRGTWFSLALTVWSTGEVSTEFDYDSRPPSRTPLGEAVRDDLDMYPRAVVPQWMLDESAAVGGDTGGRERAIRPAYGDADSEENVLETGGPLMARDDARRIARDFVPEEPGMSYLKVTRAEGAPTDPAVTFSELDSGGYEFRKVEIFRDGSLDCAGPGFEGATTWLADDPLPSPEELRELPGVLAAQRIAPREFQEEWLIASGPE